MGDGNVSSWKKKIGWGEGDRNVSPWKTVVEYREMGMSYYEWISIQSETDKQAFRKGLLQTLHQSTRVKFTIRKSCLSEGQLQGGHYIHK